MNDTCVFDQFELTLRIEIRLCEPADLPLLEWEGTYSEHRQLITNAFARQQQGEVLMLVAQAQGYPVGQIWVDLVKRSANGAGYLSALRVLPGLQKLGIGQRLLRTAERTLQQRDFIRAEVSVDTSSPSIMKFLNRHGYEVVDTIRETYSYGTPQGIDKVRIAEEWLLRKELAPLSKATQRSPNVPAEHQKS